MKVAEIDRDASKMSTFCELANQAYTGRIHYGVFLHMVSHLFVHDLPIEMQAHLCKELVSDINAYHERIKAEFGSIANSQWAIDQKMSTIKMMCKQAFETKPDGSSPWKHSTIDIDDVKVAYPTYVFGDNLFFYVPWEPDSYDEEERGLIIEDMSTIIEQGMKDTRTKIQHMRDGEDY